MGETASDFWKGKRVAVTGGLGLIGTPLIRRLIGMAAKITILDTGAKRGRYDVTSSSDMQKGLKGQDICIHLAAISNVETCRSFSELCFDVNIRGTWTVLRFAMEQRIKATVVASSNHVYGKQEGYLAPTIPDFLTCESSRLNNLDTYAVSKICADYLARSYAHTYSLPVAIIRNTNCFGPEDPHLGHLIPSARIFGWWE